MNTSYDYQPQRIVVKLRGSNGRSLAMCVAQVHKGTPIPPTLDGSHNEFRTRTDVL